MARERPIVQAGVEWGAGADESDSALECGTSAFANRGDDSNIGNPILIEITDGGSGKKLEPATVPRVGLPRFGDRAVFADGQEFLIGVRPEGEEGIGIGGKSVQHGDNLREAVAIHIADDDGVEADSR